MLIPVIIAGGNGTRLWPLSRESHPKQYLKVPQNESMLQSTLKRLNGLNVTEPLVICNEKHKNLTYEQLTEIGIKAKDIILEPCGRNTAPAIALSAFKALEYDEAIDPILLILPADHFIGNVAGFHESIEKATELAKSGKLVTFGIVPNKPETGYGYIKRGSKTLGVTFESYDIKEFVEKPDYNTAIKYLNSGDFYWNSGMFIFRASVFLKELKNFRPDIYESCKLSLGDRYKRETSRFTHLVEEEFHNCPSESIDYAVMEHTLYGAVVPVDINWNDVGSWSALWDISSKDSHNNLLNGDIFVKESSNCYIHSGDKFVTAIGLNNLVIVNTDDSILIVNKDSSQKVKDTVDYLKMNDRVEHKHYKNLESLHSKVIPSNFESIQVFSTTINKLSCNEKAYRETGDGRTTLLTVFSGDALVKYFNEEYNISTFQSHAINSNVHYEIVNLNPTELIVFEVVLVSQ